MDLFADLDVAAAEALANSGRASFMVDSPACAGYSRPLEQDDLPPIIRHYIEAWPRYIASIRQAETAMSALRAEERALSERQRAWVWDPLQRETIRSLARSVLHAMTGHARDEFCSGDDTILSDREGEQIVEESGALRDRENPNFVVYWRALERRYGRGVGRHKALVRAARELRSRLGIPSSTQEERNGRRRPPKMERGGVTFDVCLHVLEGAVVAPGYRISYHGSQGIRRLTSELQSVLGSTFDAEPHAAHFSALRDPITPPYRAEIGGCRWTLLKADTRLWMPQDLALQLRARLDELDP